MWHEARKQEKMIRGMIVDYRRRAERRKDFYEKIKADPTQFLQLHGRPCKIHLDPAIAAAGEGPAIMMPWQGETNNMIDRFDVRAHLDYIPEVKAPDIPPEDLSPEERQCNYERYRILAQNAFLGMSEDKFLQQLAIEEQFGVTLEEKEMAKEKLNEKKGTGAAIGYNYSDPTAQPSTSIEKKVEPKDSDDDSDLEILDVDLSIDVNKMEASQAHELNAVGPLFGMAGCDLFSFLTGDADDAEHQKQLLREEKEKAMFSGRKSRRERRAHRDKKLATRVVSPPSYAAPAPAGTTQLSRSPSPARSPSHTPSPEPGGTIEFITSFGGDDDEVKPPLPSSKPLYSEKVKQNLKKQALYSEIARKNKARSPIAEQNYSRPIGPRGPDSRSHSRSQSKSLSRSRSRSRERSHSRSRSRSRSRSYRKSRSRSRSRSYRKSTSKSRLYSRSRSRSRSRSYDSYRRSKSRSRSRSRSRNYRGKRSRSISNTTSAKRNKSRSMSYESSERGVSKPSVPRYYGRRKEDKSSSELSLDSDSSDSVDTKNKSSMVNKSNSNPNQLRSSGSSTKGSRMSRETLSLKEKLKRKMQAQLSRQLRADKRAEAERLERERGRQARRDEEMRELAIKLRRKQREMRHKYRRSSDESDRSRSGSSSRDSAADERRSQSRSPSPERPERQERPPVWETKDSQRYNPENRNQETIRSRSRSPEKRYPVWEPTNQNAPPYPTTGPSCPDRTERPFYRNDNPRYNTNDRYEQRNDNPRFNTNDRYEQRNDNPRFHSNDRYEQRNDNPRFNTNDRYEQRNDNPRFNSNDQYDNRFDGNRRRPYGNRGGYRGYGRPPSVGGGGPSHWKEEKDDGNRGKVKLVDY